MGTKPLKAPRGFWASKRASPRLRGGGIFEVLRGLEEHPRLQGSDAPSPSYP